MFRNESDLLCSLASAIKKIKNQTKSNENFNDIEKYRDNDGFINLTKVNDINEVSRIIDLVDKKNFIEELENSTNLQEKAEGLAKTLKDMFNIDSVKVKISTPDGETCAKIGSDCDVDEVKKVDTVEETPCNESCVSGKCSDTKVEKCDKEVKESLDCEEDFELDNEVIVLHSVGGESFNAPFYNAVLHICENEYFPESGVYAEDEDYPEKVDVRILLPNVWNKMMTEAIEYFEECLANGEEIYVIDPETFDLIDINNSLELWDYAMTSVQESEILNY